MIYGKHSTMIFTKVLAGCCQQGLIPIEKRNILIKEWNSGMKSNDAKVLANITNEVYSVTENARWRKELMDVLEDLNY